MVSGDVVGRFVLPSDSRPRRRRLRREKSEAWELFGLRLMENNRCTDVDKEEAGHSGMKKVASVRDWLHQYQCRSITTTRDPLARFLLGLVVGRVFGQATLFASFPHITSNDDFCKEGAVSISKPTTVDLATTGHNPHLNESFFDFQKRSNVGPNQSYVVVGLLVGFGGHVSVILTVIDRDYSWLTAGDLTDVIRLEEKREERTRKRRELRGLKSLPSGGSSVEIGAEIYCDALEVDICDTSSSGGSAVDASELTMLSSTMGFSTSTTHFHKSISMTTLIAMAGDGSVTSRRGSISKYSRTSTDDVESCKKDFGFRRPEVHSKYQDFLSDLSFTSTIKWHTPPLEVDEDIGRLNGFKRLLRRSQDTASSCSSCSSYNSGFSLKRLLCCGGEDWSDDDDY
ncbi:hypothetical protein BSKO_08850 [Bryopsis sp. KO-2023]|nr:hypothetical protein BSKO_08850 [Bryopsis sp. KO-2023]